MPDGALDQGLARPLTLAPLLAARGLGLCLGGRPLLAEVDLAIRPGAVTMVMGPNGAGKSLLLRLLHGMRRPTTGAVLWQGRPLDRAGRRAQAMVFQRPLMLRRSVAANLRFALAVRGVTGAARSQRVAEALALAGLEDAASRPARLLSGGEQQRLAMARALALRPRLLFLDEPTASLDPAATLAVEDLVRTAGRAGTTVVMVTHDLGQARRLGAELIFLDRGRVAEAGPLSRHLARPQSPALAAWVEGRIFLGEGAEACR